MKNKNKALTLLDSIISEAEIVDEQQKLKAIEDGKGSKAVGQSWLVFHLKNLKKLIDEEE